MDKVKRAIEFIEWVCSHAETHEDIEHFTIQLFELNKLLSLEP
jgi:hypothetical protein